MEDASYLRLLLLACIAAGFTVFVGTSALSVDRAEWKEMMANLNKISDNVKKTIDFLPKKDTINQKFPYGSSSAQEISKVTVSSYGWDAEKGEENTSGTTEIVESKIPFSSLFLPKKPPGDKAKCQDLDPCVVGALSDLNNSFLKMWQNLSEVSKIGQKIKQRVDELDNGSEIDKAVIDFKDMRKKIAEQDLAFRQFKNIIREIEELQKEDFTNPRFEENYPTLFSIVYLIKDLLDGKASQQKVRNEERELQEVDGGVVDTLKFRLAQAGQAIRDLENEVEELKQMKYSIYVLSSQMAEMGRVFSSLQQQQQFQQPFQFGHGDSGWHQRDSDPLIPNAGVLPHHKDPIVPHPVFHTGLDPDMNLEEDLFLYD